MNQDEEESIYNSLEEEAIDVNCLLIEPRSDQVSVSGVWCYEEDSIGKCIKTENNSYSLGARGLNVNMEGVDTTNLNGFDALPHEVGVGNFLTTSNISPCDDYLLDFGFDHAACIGYVSNERLHVENSQFPMKASFGIQNNVSGNECQNYFLSNCVSGTSTNSSEPKSFDRFDDFSKSFINQDISPPIFSHNGLELTSSCKDGPTSTNAAQDHGGVDAVTHKRSRKPTKRYIDESSIESLKNSKKRREASSVCKVKPSGFQHIKNQDEIKRKDKMTSSDISFDIAIQVPFISQESPECQKSNSPAKVRKSAVGNSIQVPLVSQGPSERKKNNSLAKVRKSAVGTSIQEPLISQRPSERQKSNSPAKVRKSAVGDSIHVPLISKGPSERLKNNSPAKIESCIDSYSSGSEDDSDTIMGSVKNANQRKLHRLWSVSEVKKLIDGVAHFGVGKWTHIKKSLFSSSVHRTPVDLKDKWRNLLKASHAIKGSSIEDENKRSQPWRPLPKTILCRVRELASAYPYPRESNSKIPKSKVPLAHHGSAPARIKTSKVTVV